VHEFAHAFSAYRLGDPTAFRLGRCSLNPLAHLDPIGSLCLLFAPIGWAKPVPVNPMNLRNPRRDDILISAAGPASNLLQAFLYALLLRAVVGGEEGLEAAIGGHGFTAAYLFCYFGVWINVGLAVFNLIPVYPLDGFHVVGNLAKGESQQRFFEMARFGPFIIVALVFLSGTRVDPLGRVMAPFLRFFLGWVAGLRLVGP